METTIPANNIMEEENPGIELKKSSNGLSLEDV